MLANLNAVAKSDASRTKKNYCTQNCTGTYIEIGDSGIKWDVKDENSENIRAIPTCR